MTQPKIIRAIQKVWKSQPTLEGAGVHLKRVFGFHELPMLDPFLLLDDFRSENPNDYKAGFPWHPHRGIETITYVLDGDVEHGDSLGNKGIISAGDVQWMTAGSGIIHQEMPQGNKKGEMFGFQLWANLPANAKMTPPQYREVKRKDIPVINIQGAKIHVICGKVENVVGPIEAIKIDPEFLDVELSQGKTFTRTFDVGKTVFAYVIDGKGYFDPQRSAFTYEATGANYFDMAPPCACTDGMLVLYGPGEQISISALENSSVRFLLISGTPLHEPIAWYGPIVMNTQQELKQAFKEFKEGSFVKHK